MSCSAPLPKDHPTMVAWEKIKSTEEFKDALRWALATKYDDGRPIADEFRAEHVLGSLWFVFAKGLECASQGGEG